jgi:exosortase E/protease (VPEID-CTERM system)
VSTPFATALSSRSPLPLIPRLGIIAAILVVETLLVSYLIQETPVDWLVGPPKIVRNVQHWLFRFLIAYAVSMVMLVYVRGSDTLAAVSATGIDAPVRGGWWLVHLLLLVPFAVLSAGLYGGALTLPLSFSALAIAWHACAFGAALALFAALAPLGTWMKALRRTHGLSLYALLPAAGAVIAIQASQMLWVPMAQFTFRLVRILLIPSCPSLRSDASTLTIDTDNFAVRITEICSGLEGMGLMLAFCTAWLWYFRREYYFPRALALVPVAMLLVFLLNAARIAALILIGNAGYDRIATVGFHSQAGWIMFNFAALGVAILARRSPWVHRDARQSAAATDNAAAGYLMPLLTVLAAGMIAHALSSGFDLLYPLRVMGAIAALWVYRRSYAALDRTFTWRAPAVGALLFGVWVVFAHFLTTPSPMPETLSLLPPPLRAAWIGCRVAAATITVPLVEELAYRGYLLRRLVRADFRSVAFQEARWPALWLSAIAFGITHGGLWLPGILAGWAYGALAMRTGKLSESVAAHAVTNTLLAVYVLLFNQWQLW